MRHSSSPREQRAQAARRAGHLLPLPEMPRAELTTRERRALSVAIFALPVVLVLLGIALFRDLWAPFRQIAVMFFLGWLIAFLLDPVVTWLDTRFPRLPRGPTAAVTFLAVAGGTIAIMGAIALSFVDSVLGIISQGPSIGDALTEAFSSVQTWANSVGIPVDFGVIVDGAVASAKSQLAEIVATAVGGSLTVLTMGTTIVFIAVVMVGSKTSFLLFTRRLVPDDQLDRFDRLSAAIADSFGGFIRGQFGLAGLYGVLVSVVALIFGVPFVAFVGVTTALLQSIPYFGQLVSWIPLVLTAFVFTPDQVVPIIVIMAAGLLIVQNIVSPRVLGSAVGLNPLVVLAAVFIGGALAGPLGAVFGVPVLAALASLFVAWLDHVRPASAIPPPMEFPEATPAHQ